MLNIDAKVDGTVLTLTVNLDEQHGRSSSGKSIIIASSQGNQSVPGHEEIKFGLNVYTK
jgi:hypothetical protein